MRLTQANLHSDLDAIAECQRVLTPVRAGLELDRQPSCGPWRRQGSRWRPEGPLLLPPVRYRPNP